MKTYWASRDIAPSVYSNHIKIWDKKPKLTKHNGKWRGGIPKIIINTKDWEQIASYNLDKGVCVKVEMSFNFACPGSEEE
jgi:hypothetical protein